MTYIDDPLSYTVFFLPDIKLIREILYMVAGRGQLLNPYQSRDIEIVNVKIKEFHKCVVMFT